MTCASFVCMERDRVLVVDMGEDFGCSLVGVAVSSAEDRESVQEEKAM